VHKLSPLYGYAMGVLARAHSEACQLKALFQLLELMVLKDFAFLCVISQKVYGCCFTQGLFMAQDQKLKGRKSTTGQWCPIDDLLWSAYVAVKTKIQRRQAS
jgi:hypothetical protein